MTDAQIRKIIHIDADAFYASVEMRENPALKGQPIAVGGKPNGRGVVATCNYEARAFGIRSAMPSAHALKRCPKLLFIKPNFTLYREVSSQIRDIMLRYTSVIEPLSLDEAYLDVTNASAHQGSATRIAQAIQHAVEHEVGITVSAGVAPNKFLAKVASDWKKPNGLFVIQPREVAEFVAQLPINKINGVGKVTTQKLNDLGIFTCRDLQHVDQDNLIKRFGQHGKRLLSYAVGIDNRPVQTQRERKSLSVEHTFNDDTSNVEQLLARARPIYDELIVRARKLPDDSVIDKRFVKIKFNDFTQTTYEKKLGNNQTDWRNFGAFVSMLQLARQRSERPIRLLGLGIRMKPEGNRLSITQLDLFSSEISPSNH